MDSRRSKCRKSIWWQFVLIAVVALFYAVFTDHTWEDYYISYRCSKNLALGNGLVFQLGERVQAYTSPLQVLILAAIDWSTGNKSDRLVLWAFRILSVGLLAGAWANLRCALKTWRVFGLPTLFLLVLLAFECKIVAFSMNGQEAAFMIFFLSAAMSALTREKKRWINIGWVFASLMYARPDGFVYGGALVAGFILFPAKENTGNERRNLVRDMLRGGLLALLIYSPWLIWSAWYYGSPIPHTILAKHSTIAHPISIVHLLKNLIAFPILLFRVSPGIGGILPIFAPIYSELGDWSNIVYTLAHYTALAVAFYWILPFGGRPARGCSFALFLSLYYLSYIAAYPSPWYLPSAVLFGIVTLALLAADVTRFESFLRRNKAEHVAIGVQIVFIASVAIVLAGIVTLFVLTAFQMRVQQHEVEIGNRKAIGLWLKENARTPTDTVFLEPLGYIGFFSGLKMYDYPGLSSPDVVSARRKLGQEDWAPIIRDLKPVWLVLRPTEVEEVRRKDPALLEEEYQLELRFDATKRIEAYRWIPGIAYLYRDCAFNVYSRLNREALNVP